jgi:N-acyl-D-aspartate/D-glutamate deacylase
MHDLLIRGARIVDGAGGAAFAGNVGVRDGRISYVGPDTQSARTTIDARGRYLAPGFIDIHTHYDAQITWDPWIRPHSQHGVTTYICGNCGFTLAPVTSKALDYLVPMLAKVEGIPHASLVAGAKLNWNSTGEMLAYLDGKVGVNIGFMTGHSTLRTNVMGERAHSNETSRSDIDQMKKLLKQSLAEGSLGFSSSHIETHKDHEGEDVPSLHASRDELLELMTVVKDYEGTTTGYVLTGRPPSDDDMRFMAQVSLASGRPYSWPLLTHGQVPHEVSLRKMRATDVARAMGAELRVQSPSCPLETYVNFKSGLGYDQFPGLWNGIYRKPHADRIAAFADQSLRRQLEQDALSVPAGDNTSFMAQWDRFRIEGVQSEKNQKYVGRMVRDIAKEQGKNSFNALLDIVVEDKLRTVLLSVDENRDVRALWSTLVDTMRDTRTVWGGDDGGAHLDALEAYSHGTRFIENAVRKYGLMPIEEAIYHFTLAQAQFMGIRDRGVIAVGAYADLVLFDLDRVRTKPVEFRSDFPANGERLYTGAEGFDYVIVNGKPIIAEGVYTTALPGAVLRAGKDTYTVDPALGAAITSPSLPGAEVRAH